MPSPRAHKTRDRADHLLKRPEEACYATNTSVALRGPCAEETAIADGASHGNGHDPRPAATVRASAGSRPTCPHAELLVRVNTRAASLVRGRGQSRAISGNLGQSR
eukprot:2828905-Pleurochrysis_carterae.AAC.1